jgi:flagellar biogenesis protein FliO
MFDRSSLSHVHARTFLAAAFVIALSQLCPIARAEGQETLSNDAANKATPNQSLEIAPADSDGVSPAEVVDEGSLAPAEQDEAKTLDQSDAQSAPTRTLRRRSMGTAILGRPESADTPWYRSGIGALSIVLVVIVGVFIMLRRYVPAMRAPEGDVLKVVARASLTPKQTLSLIQLGRRFVLVAISAGRVDALCEVNDVDEVAELIMATGGKFPGRTSEFDTQLRSEAANYDASTAGELEEVADLPEKERGRAVSDLLERLKTLQRTG